MFLPFHRIAVTMICGASSQFVSSSILSWQILTAHTQPFRGARDLVFCLKVPLDSLLIWASSGGSGETARMRRLAWTFSARIGDKYQIRLTRPIWHHSNVTSANHLVYSPVTLLIVKVLCKLVQKGSFKVSWRKSYKSRPNFSLWKKQYQSLQNIRTFKLLHSSPGPVQRVIYSYEMTSENYNKVVLDMINDWTAMCYLYTVVRQFADFYDGKWLFMFWFDPRRRSFM